MMEAVTLGLEDLAHSGFDMWFFENSDVFPRSLLEQHVPSNYTVINLIFGPQDMVPLSLSSYDCTLTGKQATRPNPLTLNQPRTLVHYDPRFPCSLFHYGWVVPLRADGVGCQLLKHERLGHRPQGPKEIKL